MSCYHLPASLVFPCIVVGWFVWARSFFQRKFLDRSWRGQSQARRSTRGSGEQPGDVEPEEDDRPAEEEPGRDERPTGRERKGFDWTR